MRLIKNTEYETPRLININTTYYIGKCFNNNNNYYWYYDNDYFLVRKDTWDVYNKYYL